MSHFIVVCSKCGATVSQCKCPSFNKPKELTYTICKDCKKKKEEEFVLETTCINNNNELIKIINKPLEKGFIPIATIIYQNNGDYGDFDDE